MKEFLLQFLSHGGFLSERTTFLSLVWVWELNSVWWVGPNTTGPRISPLITRFGNHQLIALCFSFFPFVGWPNGDGPVFVWLSLLGLTIHIFWATKNKKTFTNIYFIYIFFSNKWWENSMLWLYWFGSFHNAFWLHDFRNFILILRFISYLTCDPKRLKGTL